MTARRCALAGGLVLALSLLACAEPPAAPGGRGDATAPDEPAPALSLLPWPSDLLLHPDESAGLVDPRALSDADEERLARFSDGGFPVTSPIAIPLAPGDEVPAALEEALLVLDRTEGTLVDVEARWDAEARQIRARPTATEGFAPGHRFVVALVADGVARPAWLRPLLAREALHDEELEQLRRAVAPDLDALSALGVAREELAALFSFTTESAPSLWFSPDQGRAPFPNALLVDEATGRLRLPAAEEGEPSLITDLRARLAESGGFSTTGAVFVETTGPAARAPALAPTAFRLFRVDDDEVEEVTDLERGVFDDGRTLWIRPSLALEHSARYAYVVTRAARSSAGAPFALQDTTALLLSRAPLVKDGRSQALGLRDDEARRLERARLALAPLLAHLEEEEGLSRDDLALAVPFETQGAPELVLAHRAELYLRDVPTAPSDVVIASPWDRGLWIAMPRVETVVTGRIPHLDWLDPYTRQRRSEGPVVSEIEFALTIPEGAEPGAPLPVVLFGHGLLTSRELVYGIADELARAGYAAFAIDLPYHGERSICLEDAHCADGAVCVGDGSCALPSGERGRLRQVASPWEHGPSVPITTGQGFIDVEDLFATRDHFLQGLTDLSQAVRVLRSDELAQATGGYVVDPDDISYAGISLGGIFGASLSATEPLIGSFALNVPGADLVRLMEDSDTLGVVMQDQLAAHGVEVGSEAYLRFQTWARWVLDPVDPLNLVHHATRAPLAVVDPVSGDVATAPDKRLLIQMAEGDLVVPNSGTEQLSRRAEVPISAFHPLVSGHGFLFDPTSLEGGRARRQVVEFLDAR